LTGFYSIKYCSGKHLKQRPFIIDTQSINRILIVRLSAIGDVVRTLPALAVIRRRFPNAFIAWVVEEKAGEILMGRKDLDEVIVFPRRSLARQAKNPLTLLRAVATLCRFVRYLKAKRFDVAVDFHGLLKSALISYFSGAPVRFGFEKGFDKEMNHLFSTRRVSLPEPKLSRVRRNLLMAEALCGPVDTPRVRIEPSKQDRAAVDRMLKKGSTGDRPRIIVHPGTSAKTAYKRWDARKFAEAADLVVSRHGGEVIVTGGPGEEAIVSETARHMKHKPSIIDGPLSLLELAALFETADLYIGGDTGPTHISSFVGTPVAVVFGPTDPVENEPYSGTPFRMVRVPSQCSPCREKTCTRADCFDGITPLMVAQAAGELLAETGKTGSRHGI
jgi:heptosyltransferase I